MCEHIRLRQLFPNDCGISPGNCLGGNVAAYNRIWRNRAVSSDCDALLHDALNSDPDIFPDRYRTALDVFGVVAMPRVNAVEIVIQNPAFGEYAPRSYCDPLPAAKPGPVEKCLIAYSDHRIGRVSVRSDKHSDMDVVPDNDSARAAYFEFSAEDKVASDLNAGPKQPAPECEQSASEAATNRLPGIGGVFKATTDFFVCAVRHGDSERRRKLSTNVRLDTITVARIR